MPTLVQEPVKTSGRARILLAPVLLSGAVLLWVVAGFNPLLAPLVPAAAEERIGTSIARRLASQLEPGADERLAAAEALTRRLTPHFSLPLPPRVAHLRSPEINGFVLPGGRLLLTTGALEKLDSPESLAFLIGHLLAHLSNHDNLEMLDRGLALAVTSDFLGLGREQVAGWIVDGGILTRQKFRNRQELDADRWSMLALQREFGRVDGAIAFFRTLDAQGWPLSHFDETPASAHARKRALQLMIRDEGWTRTVAFGD